MATIILKEMPKSRNGPTRQQEEVRNYLVRLRNMVLEQLNGWFSPNTQVRFQIRVPGVEFRGAFPGCRQSRWIT